MRSIIEEIRNRGPGTDHELSMRLGYGHRQYTAPRITTLLGMGVLVELGDRKDQETGKHVRVVGLHDHRFLKANANAGTASVTPRELASEEKVTWPAGEGEGHERTQGAQRVEPSAEARDAWRMCARGNPVVAEQLNLGF
jgi:hypothetical protein